VRSEVVHLASWRWEVGGSAPRWATAVRTPYSIAFVEGLKERCQPSWTRLWAHTLRVWLVEVRHKEALRELLLDHWPLEEICHSCRHGVPCEIWAGITAVGEAEGYGGVRRKIVSSRQEAPRPVPMERPSWAPPTLTAARRLLGVTPQVTPQALTAAFRAKAMTTHPDHGGTHEGWLTLRTAFEMLGGRI
jgi:hypothetical protein